MFCTLGGRIYFGTTGADSSWGSLARNSPPRTVLGPPPQPAGRVLLWDCWEGVVTLPDINGDQHCIHLASLGSGWQEGTDGSPCFRSNTLLSRVSILHVLVGASGIWVLDMHWFASMDFAHIPSKAQCALLPKPSVQKTDLHFVELNKTFPI